MQDKEILEKMLQKTSQQLLKTTLEKIEVEVQAEGYLNQNNELQKELEAANIELNILRSRTDASIQEVKPEDLNLPPLNK